MAHHHHHHHHGNQHHRVLTIIGSAVLLIAAIIIEKRLQPPTWSLLLIYLVPYLLAGFSTLRQAAHGILHGEVFNEHLLMSVATLGALAIGFMPHAEPEMAEAVFVMLFFQIGELFEHYAEGQSRRSIAHLMAIRPDVAHVERQEGTVEVEPEQVKVGEVIVVSPGEKIPLDGVILTGHTSLNTVALTGESLPQAAAEGDEVASGCVNLSGVIRLRTTKTFGESTVSKIIELVEHASENKSRSEAFITRFARIYTPVVVFAALALALLPPFFAASYSAAFPVWLHRALIFLVVSCPCALVISIPLTFFGGIGGASRQGILIKGANYIDALAKVGTVVFDKTGTLTEGRFAVEAVHPDRYDPQTILHLAAHVEHFSPHPIAAALRDAFPEEATDGCQVQDIQEVAGAGISAKVGQQQVAVGNERMMEAIGTSWRPCHHSGTIVHVAIDGEYAGHIVINDKLKEQSPDAIRSLTQLGVSDVIMLTGDRKEVAQRIAGKLSLTGFQAELLPEGKVMQVEHLLQTKAEGATLAFVGDGINDAPVLARADIGIAMGALGSDAAIEAADVVLMDDNPRKIASAVSLSRHTIGIARQNVAFAIGIKLSVLGLAAFGLATMWMAAFADVGVTVLAVLNAMRALAAKGK